MKKVATIFIVFLLLVLSACKKESYEESKNVESFPVPESSFVEMVESGFNAYRLKKVRNSGDLPKEYYEEIERWGWKEIEGERIGAKYTFSKKERIVDLITKENGFSIKERMLGKVKLLDFEVQFMELKENMQVLEYTVFIENKTGEKVQRFEPMYKSEVRGKVKSELQTIDYGDNDSYHHKLKGLVEVDVGNMIKDEKEMLEMLVDEVIIYFENEKIGLKVNKERGGEKVGLKNHQVKEVQGWLISVEPIKREGGDKGWEYNLNVTRKINDDKDIILKEVRFGNGIVTPKTNEGENPIYLDRPIVMSSEHSEMVDSILVKINWEENKNGEIAEYSIEEEFKAEKR